MWQDTVILAGSIVAIASLFPTLLDENASVPLSTSVPTLVVLSGQGVAFYTLDLLGSAVGALAGFVVWSLIAYFKSPDDAGLVPADLGLDFDFGSDDPPAGDSTPAAETGTHQSGHAPRAD
ncbi:hypothetical protein [Halorussus lipolyticus]|uniref:hypothetical protein n=1 Tax=Halorussus lipolyticus TaxID=3034024 RepID=UPI0023E7C072|nr:hypothetical protein [Halorussus sp. DT80]